MKSIHLGATLLAALLLAAAVPLHAAAATFTPGNFESYGQSIWGSSVTDANALLLANFGGIYPGNIDFGDVGGSGFFITITSAVAADNFLPATGAPGALTSSFLDPALTSAGRFAGDVLALRLDVDFADAGLLAGSGGIKFGDLVIGQDMSGLPALPSDQIIAASFHGLTIRQFETMAERVLGGASPYSSDYLSATQLLGTAFTNGSPAEVAQRQLSYPSAMAVPEPASWSAMLVGLACAGGVMRRRRHRRRPLPS